MGIESFAMLRWKFAEAAPQKLRGSHGMRRPRESARVTMQPPLQALAPA